jgi:hypothetical protein
VPGVAGPDDHDGVSTDWKGFTMLELTICQLVRELMNRVEHDMSTPDKCARDAQTREICKLALQCVFDPPQGRAIWQRVILRPDDPPTPTTGGPK